MTELRRDVDLPRAVTYGVGQILGAGIYAILGEAAGRTGESVVVSFLLAALVASFTGLSYAELASRFPVGEGDFIYVRRAFADPRVSAAAAVGRFLVGVSAAATVALAFAGYLSTFVAVPTVPTAVALVVATSAVNFLGIEATTRLNVAFVAVEVLGLLVVVWVGLGSLGTIDVSATPEGLGGLFGATFLIFFAYIGFEDLVNVAEETEDATVTIPRAILLSIAITTVLYVLVAAAAVAVVDWRVLGRSASPLALVAGSGLGPGAASLVAAVALFATTNTVLINLVSTSRLVYGVSKAEHRTFPTAFSRIHPGRRTPHLAVALVGAAAIPFVLVGDVGTVAALANVTMLSLFALVNASLLRIRLAPDQGTPAFRAPLNAGRVPLTAVAGLVSALLLVGFYLSTLV